MVFKPTMLLLPLCHIRYYFVARYAREKSAFFVPFLPSAEAIEEDACLRLFLCSMPRNDALTAMIDVCTGVAAISYA